VRRSGRRSQLRVPERASRRALPRALTLALPFGLLFGLLPGLGGCAGGLGGLITKSPPPAFNLEAAGPFPGHGRRIRGQLAVAEPVALAALDSEKIVVRPTPAEAAAMPDAQWQDRLTRLVQARLIESFENAGALRAVGRPSDKLTVDYVLMTDIRAFEISVADGTAVIEVAAKIVRERTGRIMAARVFRVSVPAAGHDGAPAVAALNEAFGKLEHELVLWAARVV
jgi:cholesterol transport system auxiliary component